MPAHESNRPRPSKKSFILSRPDLSAKEVVAAAAQDGIHFSVAYVYVTRSEATLKARRAAHSTSPRGVQTLATDGRGLEATFVDLALDVGLARADRLLGRLRLLGHEVISHA